MKMKNKKTVIKSNIKIIERDKIDTVNTQIYDGSLSWLGYYIQNKFYWVKYDFMLQFEIYWEVWFMVFQQYFSYIVAVSLY
jgi:hypothetical protein